jgi:NDP-sugar pyrophosphorylase family protein
MTDDRNPPAVMVLCAGLGTRLRPLTDELAKPMVPVGDRPAVAHVVQRVRLAGATRIVVNVHHRPDDVRAWAEGEGIAISHERELLGTAGGVARARVLLGDGGDVLVWNGDILSELDPRALLATHAGAPATTPEHGHGHGHGHEHEHEHGHGRAHDHASARRGAHLATLAVRARGAGEGNVGFDERGRITRLRAESFGPESRGGEFLGIHVIGDELRARLPESGCLVGDVYLPALRRGEQLRVHVTEAPFVDVGSLAQYLAANAAWLAARGLSSWTHPTATINAPIDGSVVGAGAVVDAPATRSVVWAGARVRDACERAVVTPASTTPASTTPASSTPA